MNIPEISLSLFYSISAQVTAINHLQLLEIPQLARLTTYSLLLQLLQLLPATVKQLLTNSCPAYPFPFLPWCPSSTLSSQTLSFDMSVFYLWSGNGRTIEQLCCSGRSNSCYAGTSISAVTKENYSVNGKWLHLGHFFLFIYVMFSICPFQVY